MFFVFGISNEEKKLDFVQTMICPRCGSFGRFELYITYMYFSLFFIPVFRWNKRYYIKSTCCNSIYEINQELGKRMQRGEAVNLTEHEINDTGYMGRAPRACYNCGYPASQEFDYCPKCGRKL